MNIRTLIALLLIVFPASQGAYAQAQPAAPATQNKLAAWDKLVDEFFDTWFKFRPSSGTNAGFHQYDDQLEDYSAQAIDAEVSALKDFETRFADFDLAGAPASLVADRDLVVSRIRGRLLDLESIRAWEKNPDVYSSAASRAIFTLITRDFAPASQRLKSVISRERTVPNLFTAARANLKNPPGIYTQIALQQLPGIIGFFQKDVSSAFDAVKDEGLKSEFRLTNQAVIAALQAYQKYLKEELLPVSKGEFAIGADAYSRKLEFDEMVNIPLERLLQIGYDDLYRNQQELKTVAAKIDPKKTPQQVLAMLGADHDVPGRLLEDFRETFSGLKAFIAAKGIVNMPSQDSPVLRETPPFMRALTFASMNSPGPYETVARQAFFSVTLPEQSWTPKQVDQQMEFFNRYAVTDIAIHEAFPGHFTQFLFVRDVPTKIRKLMGCSSNAEGWAHYAEQMMLDEGYSNGDPKLRASQLQQAMIRDARYIVGISMHTGKMTLEQGMDFFVNEGHMPRGPAEREAMRGTSDPTYLVYTLGKLEILKLREDVRKAKGGSFNLEQFHDEFLRQGYPPVRLIRRAMLGSDGEVL